MSRTPRPIEALLCLFHGVFVRRHRHFLSPLLFAVALAFATFPGPTDAAELEPSPAGDASGAPPHQLAQSEDDLDDEITFDDDEITFDEEEPTTDEDEVEAVAEDSVSAEDQHAALFAENRYPFRGNVRHLPPEAI